MNEMKTIKISENLFEKIKTRIKNPEKDFSTVDEYVEYVLTELFQDDDSEKLDDEEEVRDELRKMGYIE